MTTRNESTLVGTDAPQGKKLAGLGLVGAVISGFLASACCIGPLLMVFLGIGSAGALTALEPWRPVMMVLTFLFLGLGFHVTYRRPQTADCSETACCSPGRKRLQKIMLWLATLFSLAMLFAPQIMSLLLD
ncbi:mercury transporter MerT [Geothermobacter hydrogeniphilus]|uniref:Mercuric transport protein MerT n=1 Tax=Geothermobacter hydrogeniphilus TaxID=1969733 RepID=A0A2K2HAZ0_9BACT|nr:mercuric transporter MerT family protein [Geothermobacter hydrogeniphilus]PNU20488.1 mercury transporter MerT [Geothermobacter hydrogeniphilus]